jgi:hypothetical protein
MEFKRARGTTDVPLTVSALDHLYSLRFNGYTGAGGSGAAATIRGEVHNTVSTGIVSGKLRFLTANTSGVMTTAMDIGEDQVVRIVGGLSIPNTTTKLFHNSDTAFQTDGVEFNRSRGTITAPTTTVSGDNIFGLKFYGYDGTSYVLSSQIRGEVATTVATGIVPGRIRFSLCDTAGAIQNIMFVGNLAVTINREIKQSTTTATTSRAHEISSATRLVENGNYVGYTQLVTGIAEAFTGFSYAAATYRGAKLTFTVTRSTGDVRVQEVLIANDATTATSAPGSPLTRGTDPISLLAVDVSPGNVRLRLTTDTGNTAGDITKVTVQAALFNL